METKEYFISKVQLEILISDFACRIFYKNPQTIKYFNVCIYFFIYRYVYVGTFIVMLSADVTSLITNGNKSHCQNTLKLPLVLG